MLKVKYIFIFGIALHLVCGFTKYNLPCDGRLLDASLDSALSQIGVEESGRNSSAQIDEYLRSVGLAPGAPYCAAGQYWAFSVAAHALGIGAVPIARSGLANAIFADAAARGVRTTALPEVHDLVVWNKAGTPFGHIERIVRTGKAGWVETIAFNTEETSSGGWPRQGVFLKRRNLLARLGNMALRGLIGFEPTGGRP